MIVRKIFTLFLVFFSFSSVAENRAELAWKKIEQGALLVDVRTPQEFKAHHLDSAINLPLDTISTAFEQIDKNRHIVVYCRSGNRSGQAERYLKQIGFTHVHNGGGLQELLAVQ